jgi:hypothetical protein
MVLMLAGCVGGPSPFTVSVNGFAAPDSATKRTFVILPEMQGVKATDLEFEEYARVASAVLAQSGYVQVPSGTDPQLIIFLTYSIGEPKEHNYTYSLPQFGQTGVASSQTYGTVRATSPNTASYTATTYNTPTYGITGYATGSGSYSTFTRVVSLEAFDLAVYMQTKELKQVWKTKIASTGSSGDLRAVYPFMLTAAAPYIGKNTGSMVTCEIKADDPKALSLRASSPPPVQK